MANFSPEAFCQMIGRRAVWIALDETFVVGTASLEGSTVRTVFVSPTAQGRGIGHRLMQAVEGFAVEQGVRFLRVPASLTARKFYISLGYIDVREAWHGDERTYLMEKALT